MRAILVLLAASAVGCRSYVEIFDAVAERGEGDTLVVRFKADGDVTRAQFYGASLAVPAQVDRDKSGSDEVLEHGHARAGADRLVRVAAEPGTSYAFRATFPLRGEHVHERQVFFRRTSVPFPYDLSVPGRHELEFWASGANCGGPGGFYTNRLRLTYDAR